MSDRDLDRFSGVARSLISRKDAINVSESSWGKTSSTECLRRSNQLHNFQSEDVREQLKYKGSERSIIFISRTDCVQLQQKSEKLSRSGSARSKRPRIAQMEDFSSQGGQDGVNGTSDTVGSCPTNYEVPGKAQVVKQKNNLNGKRGDRRNFKVPLKGKYDSFALKAGLTNATTTAGGNPLLGLYGLRSDNNDVTNHMDDISLNELLDGSYEPSSLGKNKSNKAANVTESFFQSIKKACSIIELRKSVKSQNVYETDSSLNRMMSPGPLAATSCVSSSTISDKEETSKTELFVQNKDSGKKPEAQPNILDFPLLQPKTVLERLSLPPAKDLESLLQDATKHATLSRTSSNKQSISQACLPPFSWSHTLGVHSKTNSDATKSPSSRTTCQGKWKRIENIPSLLGIVSDMFTDLNLLTYDRKLVPSMEKKTNVSENGIGPAISVSIPCYEAGSSSSGMFTEPSFLKKEVGSNLRHESIEAEHSPILEYAAQTLVDLGKHSPLHNLSGIPRWSNKPSQKAMKSRKLKFIDTPEDCFAKAKSGTALCNQMNTKKAKLSIPDTKKDVKGTINWSAPKSWRSSPSRSIRDSMLPPPATCVFEKSFSNQQKPRKLIPMDWNIASRDDHI